MLKPIDVSITVDTEFSIGGAFAEPERFEPIGLDNVYCPANGKQNGLPFLIDTLEANGLDATFFVETMQTAWFGDAPMKQVVDEIMAAGQDVQMHLHPVWAWFKDADWKARLRRETPHDDCTAVEFSEFCGMIAEGIETLQRWGAERPVAFRTGGLKASTSVCKALRLNDIGLASNVGLAYLPPAEPELHLTGGVHEVEGILEAPVCSYVDMQAFGRRHTRLLSITAVSFPEMKSLLDQAYLEQISPIVILTHPFEFVKTAPAGRPGVRSNRINRGRFEKLCRYIAQSPDRMQAVTFAQAAAGRWQVTDRNTPQLRVPMTATVRRMASNRLNDLIPAL